MAARVSGFCRVLRMFGYVPCVMGRASRNCRWFGAKACMAGRSLFLVIPAVDMGSRTAQPTRFLQRRDAKKRKFRRNFSEEGKLGRQTEKLLRIAEINLLTLGGRQRQPRRYRAERCPPAFPPTSPFFDLHVRFSRRGT